MERPAGTAAGSHAHPRGLGGLVRGEGAVALARG